MLFTKISLKPLAQCRTGKERLVLDYIGFHGSDFNISVDCIYRKYKVHVNMYSV